LTYWFFGEKTSRNALGCCGIIIAGFLLGIDQEKGLGKLMFEKLTKKYQLGLNSQIFKISRWSYLFWRLLWYHG